MVETLRFTGAATSFRLYDVGYAIALDRAAELLGESMAGRVRPSRLDARALEIRVPPLSARPRAVTVRFNGEERPAELSAHLFDFGVCSLHLRFEAPKPLSWAEFTAFAAVIESPEELGSIFERELRELVARVEPAIERPVIAPLFEEYRVYRIDRIDQTEPSDASPTVLLTDELLVPLLIGERRPVSALARQELVPYRFSYYNDDLTVLTWESALVVEPNVADRDVELVLEFANAQLLELRLFDQQLDAELPALYDRAAAARARRNLWLTAGFRPVLSDLHTRLADVTETVERVENALKVTNDVNLARIYAAALALFRERAWRRGIDRKLAILRETYTMLNGEAQAARAELLEIAIVVLIVIELVLGIVRAR